MKKPGISVTLMIVSIIASVLFIFINYLMEITGVSITLLMTAIVATGVFILVNYINWNLIMENNNSDESKKMTLFNDIFTFIMVFSWSSLLVINLMEAIEISFIITGVISLVIVQLKDKLSGIYFNRI